MPPSDSGRRSIDLGSGVSRRDVMRQLGAASAVGATAGLAGCSDLVFRDDEDGETGPGACEDEPNYQQIDLIPPPTDLDYESGGRELEVNMVTHDAATSFFDPTVAGLHDAASQVGWSANFSGPTGGEDIEEQVTILESTVDAGPDVILTTIIDEHAYDSVLEEAVENDIVVLAYNANSLSTEQMEDRLGRSLAYVGQDNYAAGYVCGLAAAERLESEDGQVTIATCCPGHSALGERAAGIEDALTEETGVETDTLDVTDDSNEGIGRLENHIASTENLLGIVGTDAYTWFIGEALESQGVEDELLGGGFDLEEPTMEAIDAGIMDYTIGQDPYSQGYVPTILAWLYVERGIPPKDYMTGAEVIDQENIEFALERDDWSALLDQQD
ncbi:substrate-binding domain-containing protein [Natronorubrum texcoconense]|uniref:Monosaccharide ABC transporter substrate-binding protein, CUT2 family n=1 Tax=Natronorubrum texcoconense TaxID=1095776 RepID=A0A1G9CS63_9EURY|nr:substrate-binding domain-containing protein [Natronorubrum texcoconense]SDK54551.1 monosaccharide ABC transporter substrate-binding protein, CUT2 family [Natronorubrum texcoconense]